MSDICVQCSSEVPVARCAVNVEKTDYFSNIGQMLGNRAIAESRVELFICTAWLRFFAHFQEAGSSVPLDLRLRGCATPE